MAGSGGPWVDLHARLVPEAGGPAELSRSLEHLAWAARAGFRRLFIPAPGPEPAPAVAAAAARLGVAAEAMGLALRVEPLPYLPLEASAGVEPADLRRLAVPGTDVVLITLPRTKELKGPARRAGMIWRAGFVPAVFQPETHPEVQRLPELIRYLLQVGALLVLDAPSAAGYHGHGARVTAERLHRLGYYSMVAGYVGWPVGPVAPERVQAVLERVTRPRWVWRKGLPDYDLLLRGRAARLVGEERGAAEP